MPISKFRANSQPALSVGSPVIGAPELSTSAEIIQLAERAHERTYPTLALPPLRECLTITYIDDLRAHPHTEPTVAAEGGAQAGAPGEKVRHDGRGAPGLRTSREGARRGGEGGGRREAAKEASSFFKERSRPRPTNRRNGQEWWDKVNPPPAGWFENTSAAHDGPQRESVTTITIVTGLTRMRSYRWDGEKFPKPNIGWNYWYLFRTVAIDGLRDLMQHLKTATPFERTILAEPIEDTPQQAKRQLGAKSNGDAQHGPRGPAALSGL